ncbi:MAG: pseudaminic acid synthase [Lachnospiraceae bacterium]|nr:pseudaminic acid synthase [Lachnospiraceae bacterium]
MSQDKVIEINGRKVGEGYPAYIIAEMSGNHAGSIERAKEIIRAAKDAGADCIKIQTYTPDTLTIDCDNEYFMVGNGTWSGENLYQLYGKAYTPWEWQEELKEEAKKVGIDFLSTPFDETAVDFLEDMGLGFYKVASFEILHLPLLRYIARTGKPIIMSTGMSTLTEIDEAVRAIREEGNEQIALLRCASAYPAITDEMNLKTMQNMADTFGVPVGLSDHSLGSVGAVTAVAMGASIIEKHFCLDRAIENPDSSFSMNPAEFKQMVDDIRQAEKAIGRVSYGATEQEESSMVFRRSIFCVEDIKQGEVLTEKNIRVIRPGYGLAPKYYPVMLGQIALQDIKRGTPMQLELAGKQQGNILFLTNNNNSLSLYDWIKERDSVVLCRKKLTLDMVKEWNPQLIVSYNYQHMITEDIIDYMEGKVVNLHISYLPWNRGANPNVWSFLEDTPKGVTIHQVSAGLDKGKILYQKECQFDIEKETLASSYDTLHEEIVSLFKEHWSEIRNWICMLKEQEGTGSYHKLKDFEALKEKLEFAYTDTISEVLKRYRDCK